MFNPQNPLIVQSDKTILIEVSNPEYGEARDLIGRFAELVKSPEHIHTYKISNLSLWNAAASGMNAGDIINILERYSKYDIPDNVQTDIADHISRYGRLKIKKENGILMLTSNDSILITEIYNHKRIKPYLLKRIDDLNLEIDPSRRGHTKQGLTEIGFPAEDLAGYENGEFLNINLLNISKRNISFKLRDYQIDAVNTFYAGGSVYGGSGVIVLPCGSGKTLIGMEIISKFKTNTLIITPNIIAARQWIAELLDKTNLNKEQIGEYNGELKEIKPITIATYQILTYRPKDAEIFPHFSLFNSRNWGLIIYDEVHLLPAPVFRITAEIQAKRRLGLTATLVREDGCEGDVFSLIGPKKYDSPWKEIEKQGWIAEANCHEIRIPMNDERRLQYALAHDKSKYRLAAENPKKYEIVKKIVAHHRSKKDLILIIGMYIEQLKEISKIFNAPLLTGTTANKKRMEMYEKFKRHEIDLLVVSKIGNFAIDLPDANVMIQVSGTFGSRQEEAQRLGRIMRPKKDNSVAHFYTIVTKDTKDQDFSANRQLFLTEQGYKYEILEEYNYE